MLALNGYIFGTSKVSTKIKDKNEKIQKIYKLLVLKD